MKMILGPRRWVVVTFFVATTADSINDIIYSHVDVVMPSFGHPSGFLVILPVVLELAVHNDNSLVSN
jgi:hypothetical protein